ncbi:MAG: DUF637 domain-containing protein [Gammaproteobacteria bacterium]|nr:DUF637 domain-containing protein [Gammaproteobacteria bacterium]MBU1479818.1 DUF637 domain-containing protein [Gammaproteobacteria bacterium]MBU1999508.1 DUF637 domain-containing protein [Gammaproteobacteria bacterium]MBU2130683.1 DUF637 domain-containing protein [Gammaproteobacteria bacterium]MBU2186921.1 DUF637 domain-containing protein [Gammaproteobacteria bacterium]
MSIKTKGKVTYVKPIWQRFTAYLMSCLMLLQICLPATVQAVELISDSFIESDVNSNSQFERVYNNNRQFEKAFYIEDAIGKNTQTIELFHQKLLAFRKSALHSPQMIPIINNGITIIIPNYPLGKRIGDQYVQARFVRSQIFNLLNRNLLNDSYSTEVEQINDLYNQAYQFSATSSAKFGDKITRAQVNSFGHNFIWPETRLVNNEAVLVPVVHLTDATVTELLVNSHRVEFSGAEAKFNTITVNAGTIYTRRGTFISTAGNFTVNEGASVVAKGDLNLLVGGTLQNLSGRFSAKDNVNIIANQYQQKTMVHRYATKYEQGTRLGQIASVNAVNGNVTINSYSDLIVAGGTISGNNITLAANGNIQLTTQYTTYNRNEIVGGYNESQSIIEHTATRLSAKDSIYLIASGAIELNAATLFADKGIIEILASQGIYIANEFNQFESSRSGKVRKVTIQEQKLQTIAIRSSLDAGRGVLLATEFGDITLKATELKSTQGTRINAANGKVNMLLAEEQDHYYYNRVKTGFWKIKTETIEDKVETAVYNTIVGGVDIQATKGLTLEFGKTEDQSLDELMAAFKNTPDLAWMAEIYEDEDYSQKVEVIYAELLKIHKHDKSSQLGAGAMVIIAIAMAVAMGPGAGMIATSTSAGSIGALSIGGTTLISQAAIQAGALTLATRMAQGLANGDGLGDSLKSLTSKSGVTSLATSMLTAGIMNSDSLEGFEFFHKVVEVPGVELTFAQQASSLAYQAQQALIQSTVSSGVSTIVTGGNFDDFGDALVISLKHSAVNAIGAKVANKIGSLTSEGKFNEVMRYISHAALGCTLGTASASIDGSSTSSSNACTSGATGAVVGEATAQIYTHAMMSETQKELIKAMQELGLAYDESILALTPDTPQFKALMAKYNQLRTKPTDADFANLKKIKDLGVDYAKLAGGMAAFVAELEVGIAANSAENAAQNNVIPGLSLALELSMGALSIYSAWELGERFGTAAAEYNKIVDADKKQEFLIDLLKAVAEDAMYEIVIDKFTKGLKPEVLFEEIYIAAKNNPNRAIFASRLDKLMDDAHFNAMDPTARVLKKAELDAEAKAVQDYYLYKQQVPHTVITEDRILSQHRQGFELQANGRWVRVIGVKIADKPGYKRDANIRVDEFAITPEFTNLKVNIPTQEAPVTIAELTQMRQAKLDHVRELEQGEIRGALSAQSKKDIAQARYEVNTYSEIIGEQRSIHLLKQQFAEVTPLNASYLDKRKNQQFDKIYLVTDAKGNKTLIQLEAKGGINPSSQYGTAQVSVNAVGMAESAQQGSRAYQDNIWRHMKDKHEEYIKSDAYTNGTMSREDRKRVNDLGMTIQMRGVMQERQAYIAIEQSIDSATGALGTTKMKWLTQG